MPANNQNTTRFIDSSGGDLGRNLVTKEYLLSLYPDLDSKIGLTPELWVWGSGITLGTNDLTVKSTPVTTFAGSSNWKQIEGPAGIKSDGTLWLWGGNSNGTLGNNSVLASSTPVTTFAGGTNWKKVSTSGSHTAAIKTDGTLWVWGSNTFGQLGTNERTIKDPISYVDTTFHKSTPVTTFAGGTNWEDVATSSGITVAIKSNGTLWTWGYHENSLGIGPGQVDYVLTPVTTFAGGTNWADVPTTNAEDLYTIATGGWTSAGIKSDGTLWVWGVGDQYGTGGINQRNILCRTPVTTFAGGTNWRQLAVGSQQTAAIKTDGTLWIMGGVESYVTNLPPGYLYSYTPVPVSIGGLWRQVACNSQTLAIRTDGTLWGWGDAQTGQLGNGVSSPSHPIGGYDTPLTTFAGGTNWKTVAAGACSSASIKTDGTLWIWGRASSIGIGSSSGAAISTPVTTFAGGTDWKQVSCGGFFSSGFAAAIKTDGTLWVWGRNVEGQLGNNETVTRFTPVTTFAGGTDWKQVSCGSAHMAAVKTDGTLWMWGSNSFGELGTNDLTVKSTPVTTFAGGINWTQVSCGVNVTAALFNDGINRRLYLFGRRTKNQIGNNYTLSYWTDAISDPRTMVLTPVTTFAGGTNWKQVSTEGNITGAVKKDGTLWIWGDENPFFQGTFGAGALSLYPTTPITTFRGGTDWKQVSVGNYAVAAVKTDGTLWTWGNNLYSQLANNGSVINLVSVPTTTFAGGTNWKQVSTSNSSRITAAIKTDGTLWTWGSNANGQLGRLTATSNFPGTTFGGGTNWKYVSAYSNVYALKSKDYI